MAWSDTVSFSKVCSLVFIVPLDGTRFGPQGPARAELLPKNWAKAALSSAVSEGSGASPFPFLTGIEEYSLTNTHQKWSHGKVLWLSLVVPAVSSKSHSLSLKPLSKKSCASLYHSSHSSPLMEYFQLLQISPAAVSTATLTLLFPVGGGRKGKWSNTGNNESLLKLIVLLLPVLNGEMNWVGWVEQYRPEQQKVNNSILHKHQIADSFTAGLLFLTTVALG